MEKLHKMHEYMKECLLTAGETIKQYDELEITTKSNARDLVTQVDRETEEFLTRKILSKYPHHKILGEETYIEGSAVDESHLWVLDPIDGTANFVKQREDFVILAAYFEDREAKLSFIYDVTREKLFSAIKGEGVHCNGERLSPPANLLLKDALVTVEVQRLWGSNLLEKVIKESFDMRYFGSAGLDGAKVLEGKCGAFVNFRGGPWDFAPFILMAEELGLVLTDFSGTPLSVDKHSSILLATPAIHAELVNQ